MNNKLIFSGGFVLGSIAGALGIATVAKKHYAKIADDEIQSVKDTFQMAGTYNKTSELAEESGHIATTPKDVVRRARNKPDISELAQRVNYQSYGLILPPAPKSPTEVEEPLIADDYGPYVISEDELAEYDVYETFTLTYFADRVLAETNNEMVPDPEELIGPDALDAFGEDDDAVYVCDDRLRCVYEILKDEREYHKTFRSDGRPIDRSRAPHEV